MDKLIFIVDDEPAIAKLLNYWVGEKWNYKTKVFLSGEELIDNLNSNPDLILLDIMLPGINGIKLLKLLKNLMRIFLLLCFLHKEELILH